MLCLVFGTHHGAHEPTGEMPGKAEGKISQETSSNLTEEHGPSHDTKVNCGTSCPSCCGWKTGLHKYTRQKSMKDRPSIKTHRLHRLGRVPEEGSLCTCSVFTLFRCLSLAIAGDGTLGWASFGLIWESLQHFGKHLRRCGRNWGEVSGKVCYTPGMYY